MTDECLLFNYQFSFMRSWSKAFAQPATEFPLTPLAIIEGAIPAELQGTLYRNGPGCLQRGGKRVGHWFDGDGAILAVHFSNESATATYRYVKTAGYLAENAQDAFIFPNYGMKAPGIFWNNWFKPVKNAANTSVLALEDKLLALWEGGYPHALDLQTLDTWGIDKLAELGKNEHFSAHPKIDPDTGDIYNFGIFSGPNASLILYHCDAKGKILQRSTTKLSGLPLIHDFVMAGQYLIFCVSPVRINLLTTGLGITNFSDAMEWKPELGTEILVFDRHDLSLVSRSKTDPWYQWHFANGYSEKDDSVIIELVHFSDFKTNQNLKEVATGEIKTPAKGTLWQIRINPQNGKVLESAALSDRGCEFPVVPQHQVSKQWRYTFFSAHRNGADLSQEILSTVACFDHQTEYLSIVNWGENRYPTEPIFVAEADNCDQGWLLTLVYDGQQDCSEIWIFLSDHLEDEPICCLALPSVVPPGFHGTWKSA